MKSSFGLSLVLIIFWSYFAVGQDIPEITAEEIPGSKLNRNECFDGPSLWGYMNGGADIYLEYGFEILRVEELSFADETIKLEIYKMTDPVSAFGIYSIKTFKCQQSNVVTTIDCFNQYQFQAICGEYYFQLINESGSKEAERNMVRISEVLLDKIEAKKRILPITYLTDSLNFLLYDIKMVKGELGVHNKVMYLENSFDKIDGYQVYYAKRTEEGEKVKYYEIVFDKAEMKIAFLENNKDKDLQIIKESNLNILIKK